jgi:vancomycin permeability regulator SanA
MGRLTRLALSGVGVTIFVLLAPRVYTHLAYRSHIYSLEAAPAERDAIVFGAGLWRNGRPTTVLYDRIATAAALYHAGKVEHLLMSGDGLTNRETLAMRQAALELGVPEGAIFLDEAGLDTYATCYRAKTLFGIERALLVTQSFHLPRALYICDRLGLQATGVSADRRTYRRASQAWWNLRELFATANAWMEVNVVKPTPMP